VGREAAGARSLGFYPSFLASGARKRVEPTIRVGCQVVTGGGTTRGADAEVSKGLEDDAREDIGSRASDDLGDEAAAHER